MIIAIDPGSRPGCVVLSPDGRIVAASHRIEDVAGQGTWPLCITEGQWYQSTRVKGGHTMDVNALLTLAFRAGWQFRGVSALRYMKLPPTVWRNALGFGALAKEQVQKKIARDLTPDERELFSTIPASRHGDVLDAVALARAGAILAETTSEYDFK